MKKRLFGWFILLASMTLLAACGGSDDPEVPVDPTPEPEVPEEPTSAIPAKSTIRQTERTVLVYIAAENSLASYAATDIAEMAEGMTDMNTDICHLLVYVDNRSTPRLFCFQADKSGAIQQQSVREYDEQDSSDPAVMAAVLQDAFNAYPAPSYGLVLWSHGEGWIPSEYTKSRGLMSRHWWSVDNGANSSANSGTYMEISGLAEALSAAPHLDFVLFDSCFMLSAEVLYELRQAADYFIGSPAEIPGPGVCYDVLSPFFFSAATDYAPYLGEIYYLSYGEKYVEGKVIADNGDWVGGVCIGSVKSSALPALATATATVLSQYVNAESAPVYSTVQTYDCRTANLYYHDLKDFVRQQTAQSADYATWLRAFNAAMVYWGTTPTVYSAFGTHTVTVSDEAGGLSIFIPRLVKADIIPYFHQTQWYKDAGWEAVGW
jgi:hypothetical protein